MKLQALALVAVLSGIFTSASVDAGDFNWGDAFRKVQKINHLANGNHFGGGNPRHGGGNPNHVKPLPYPVHGQPTFCPPPVHKPICKPQPPICPPVCEPPVPVCPTPPVSHCPPPVNHPPVKCFVMKLMNHSGAEVYYNLNHSHQYTQMPPHDAQLIKSNTPQPHWIQYHNGQEMVEFELDPTATYAFEWQGATLVLLEIQA